MAKTIAIQITKRTAKTIKKKCLRNSKNDWQTFPEKFADKIAKNIAKFTSKVIDQAVYKIITEEMFKECAGDFLKKIPMIAQTKLPRGEVVF